MKLSEVKVGQKFYFSGRKSNVPHMLVRQQYKGDIKEEQKKLFPSDACGCESCKILEEPPHKVLNLNEGTYSDYNDIKDEVSVTLIE